jgi:very-short-patch-repair endonuclease
MRASAHMHRRAKVLRKVMTLSERRLWNWLRDRTFAGFKFRRQVPVGRFVLDFYCPALKLAIEVDGKHHGTVLMSEYDCNRALYLRTRGIEVVRVTNELLAKNSLIVEQIIQWAIENRSSPT